MAKWGTYPPDEQLRLKRNAAEELYEALAFIERKALAASDWNKRTGGPGAAHNAFAEIIQVARAASSKVGGK